MENQLSTRQERRKARTRQQIKQATALLLMEKGYEALTIQDITDRLDLARATFYIYFRDKDEAIWAIVQDSFDELRTALSRELPKDAPDKHYQRLLAIFRHVDQNRTLLGILMGDRGHIVLTRWMTDYLAQVIESDLASGLLKQKPEMPPHFVAQFMAGAMMQILSWWMENPVNYRPEDLAGWFYKLEVPG